MDIRQNMWENIVLAGGNTMFENLDKRLQQEIEQTMEDDNIQKS